MAENKIKFDADHGPYHEVNLNAAKHHGVRYSARRKQYVDSDGCPVFDKFGQRLG